MADTMQISIYGPHGVPAMWTTRHNSLYLQKLWGFSFRVLHRATEGRQFIKKKNPVTTETGKLENSI